MLKIKIILISIFLFFIHKEVSSDEISINYTLMDEEIFKNIVVGNTIVGVTRQSYSLYMLYFMFDGSCKLWKQNHIYPGKWWIEKDKLGTAHVRAFWPDYISSERDSIFSPENPKFGNATSIRYYFDSIHNSFLVAGKKFQASVILIPGDAFPSQ